MNTDPSARFERMNKTPTPPLPEQDEAHILDLETNYLNELAPAQCLEEATAHLAGSHPWIDEQLRPLQREISERRVAQADAFIHNSIEYLEKKHYLTIGDEELQQRLNARLDEEGRDLSKPLITAEEIITYVLQRLDGKSLKEASEAQLKEAFLGHGGAISDQNNRVVRLTKYLRFYTSYRFNGEIVISNHRGELTNLQRALNLFENPHTTLPQLTDKLDAWGATYQQPFDTHPLPGYARITSVTIYKNGNVAIEFPTNKLAQEFCHQFDLNTP